MERIRKSVMTLSFKSKNKKKKPIFWGSGIQLGTIRLHLGPARVQLCVYGASKQKREITPVSHQVWLFVGKLLLPGREGGGFPGNPAKV